MLITLILIYLLGINLAGSIMMGVDKKRAIRGAWRISEAFLFLCALLGGSIGCILARTIGDYRYGAF